MNQQKLRKTKKNEEKRRKNKILCTNVFKIANRQD